MVLQGGFDQIKRFAGLSISIERRITFCGGLCDLIFDREEIYVILSCFHIRIDDDAFLVVLRASNTHRIRSFLSQYIVTQLDGDTVAQQVVIKTHNLGDIIAFQL